MISTVIKHVNILLSVYQLHLIMNNKCNLLIMIFMITLSVVIMMYDNNNDKFINLF